MSLSNPSLLDASEVADALSKQVMFDLKLDQDPRWLIKYHGMHGEPLVGHILFELLDKQARLYAAGINEEFAIGQENASLLHKNIIATMMA